MCRFPIWTGLEYNIIDWRTGEKTSVREETNLNLPLRTNSKKERIIITYKGGNYDITDFIKKHPGGKEVLKENNGKNIEQQMLDAGHSDNAYNIIEKYKI